MGEPVPISLGTRSNPARHPQAGSARLVNCYAEETGEEGKTTWTLYGAPGLRDFADLNDGPIRMQIEVGDTEYVVSGRDVYTVTSGGAATRIGGIPTDGPVYYDRNRKIPPQIGMVSGGFFFVIDCGTNTLTQIVDPDLPSPTSFTVLDGYGVMSVANREYYITGIDEFTTIDGLDVGTAEALPDEIVRNMTLNRELVIFKEKSTEFHTNSGSEDFPFTRVTIMETGCLSAESCAKVELSSGKTIAWVAPDHTVRILQGYSSSVISNNELHKLIKDLHDAGNIAQLKGTAWSDGGNWNYALSSDTWSRVWNPKAGWRDAESYLMPRWRVGIVSTFGNKVIAGDWQDGKLYELRYDVYEEAGEPLIARIVPPAFHGSPFRFQVNSVHFDMAKGVGLNSSEDHIADPKLMIRWSKDAGATFSASRERSLGSLGQRAKRIQPIYRLGQFGSTGCLFEISISAPVERIAMSMSVDFERLGA